MQLTFRTAASLFIQETCWWATAVWTRKRNPWQSALEYSSSLSLPCSPHPSFLEPFLVNLEQKLSKRNFLVSLVNYFLSYTDRACLVWGTKCGGKGNCWLYDGQTLRYAFNLSAAGKSASSLQQHARRFQKRLSNSNFVHLLLHEAVSHSLCFLGFTFVGALFDLLVWYYVKDLDLYDEDKNVSNRREKSDKNSYQDAHWCEIRFSLIISLIPESIGYYYFKTYSFSILLFKYKLTW